jgi:hypothetical protein
MGSTDGAGCSPAAAGEGSVLVLGPVLAFVLVLARAGSAVGSTTRAGDGPPQPTRITTIGQRKGARIAEPVSRAQA